MAVYECNACGISSCEIHMSADEMEPEDVCKTAVCPFGNTLVDFRLQDSIRYGCHEDAKRRVRLPELYYALMKTVYLKCFECMGGLRHNIDLTQEDLIENGCPKQNKSNVCIYVKHIELLRQVRDGE